MAMSFSDTESAESVLDQIKEGKITNSATIYGILNQIINDLPGTYVAEEAQRMKDSL